MTLRTGRQTLAPRCGTTTLPSPLASEVMLSLLVIGLPINVACSIVLDVACNDCAMPLQVPSSWRTTTSLRSLLRCAFSLLIGVAAARAFACRSLHYYEYLFLRFVLLSAV